MGCGSSSKAKVHEAEPTVKHEEEKKIKKEENKNEKLSQSNTLDRSKKAITPINGIDSKKEDNGILSD